MPNVLKISDMIDRDAIFNRFVRKAKDERKAAKCLEKLSGAPEFELCEAEYIQALDQAHLAADSVIDAPLHSLHEIIYKVKAFMWKRRNDECLVDFSVLDSDMKGMEIIIGDLVKLAS